MGNHPKLRFAAIGLDHRHIYDQVKSLLDIGAECAGFWTAEDTIPLKGFMERFPQVPRVDDRHRLLEDPTIQLVTCAAIPRDRAGHALGRVVPALLQPVDAGGLDGFFAARTPQGIRYTRNGNFRISPTGQLVTAEGHPVLSKTGVPVNLEQGVPVEIQPDGTEKPVNGGRVGFFSLEMSAEQLATRIIAERTEIPSSTIRRVSTGVVCAPWPNPGASCRRARPRVARPSWLGRPGTTRATS